MKSNNDCSEQQANIINKKNRILKIKLSDRI